MWSWGFGKPNHKDIPLHDELFHENSLSLSCCDKNETFLSFLVDAFFFERVRSHRNISAGKVSESCIFGLGPLIYIRTELRDPGSGIRSPESGMRNPESGSLLPQLAICVAAQQSYTED